MAHYALIDENNIVISVVVGKNEDEGDLDWEVYYGETNGKLCKRTSINTFGNIHSEGGIPFRKNYAGIGGTYDVEADGFYAPQPFLSWILNEDTFNWEAPVDYPGDKKPYTWNEETISWDLETM